MSVNNADKGFLGNSEIVKRAEQFWDKGLSLVIDKAPLFNNKAKLYAPCVFVVGADTYLRLRDIRYTNNSKELLNKLTCEMMDAGVQFAVYPL